MNPRELLQSAQAAEREGDLARAAALLEQAARIYEEAGHPSRAAQMRRHVDRLTPGSAGDGLPATAAAAESEPLWDLGPGMVERTPTLADPALDAWCSFCCRPAREVGPLVAGPAQAFVCAACIELAAGLLGSAPDTASSPATRWLRPGGPGRPVAAAEEERSSLETAPESGVRSARPAPTRISLVAPLPPVPASLDPATAAPVSAAFPHAVGSAHPDPRSPALPRRLSGRPLDALRTQRSAVQRIEDALAAGHARVLLVGPTGSGKSTWLRHWAERGLGKAWEGTGALPEGGALLVDDVDRLEASARRMLARALPTRPVVLALDATLPAPGKEIDGRRVHGSEEVDSVAGDWLPGSVLDGLTLETFEAPGQEELRALADRWRAPDGSGATREAREEALRVAEVSPRRAHALHALLLRWWASR